MNLLPKSHKEFGEREYWNSFFKKRGNKAFEWYGEYLELCTQLHKYTKQTDKILITGCGNSNLSADLYDVGFTNIINIDISEIVIKQMTKINIKRNKMQFLCEDALNMSFENEEFNVVLDKGTLDALMPDNSEEVINNIDKYFAEIKRVLKLGGRYICISLLQEHILRKLLSSFSDRSWMLRVVRCHEAEMKNAESGDGNTLPVFVIVATKFKMLPQMMLEVCMAGDKMQRLKETNELQDIVKSVQDAAVVTNGLANNSLVGQNEVSMDLMRPGESIPRYTIYIVDQLHSTANSKYAVFIVPQGRELDWLFSTPVGRKQLVTSAKYGRLLIATTHRDQQYESLDAVKEELAHSAKMLAPRQFTGQIPFLSLGSDVGKRILVYRGSSDVSGDLVVEDVEVDGAMFRRLIFLNNQFLIQSEAKLKPVKSKGKDEIDLGYLASDYHAYMSVGVQISLKPTEISKIAIIGLGGGALCSFLHKCLDNVNITAVDLDGAILEVARKYFDLRTDDKLNVKIQEGIEFLKREAETDAHYESIIFDVDSKDRSISLSCPPKQFLEDSVMQDVAKLISTTGHFILNLVCRETDLYDSIIENLKKHFKHTVSIKLADEVNEILFATNSQQEYVIEELDLAAKNLNNKARQKKLVKVRCCDVKVMLESLSIHS